MCQDTGTAIVIGKKGQQIWTGNEDEAAGPGVYQAYRNNNLRYSQNAPLSMYEEKNTGSNLPAQIELYATKGDAYHFLFIAKGGGSANKSYLFQETKALLNPETLIIHAGKNEDAGNRRLPALPPGLCHRRHIGGV
jgi:fumarate hydratase class I